jgi:DNA polymerase beta
MGDIDILIKNKSGSVVLKDIIKRFVDKKYVIEKLALGNNKFMGLCKLSDLPARRIDILLADPSHYYFALLYFTGSYYFNIYMRKVALSKGLSLSEYGFKDSKGNLMDTTDTIHSEEDIFAYLDIPYTAPHKR